MQLRVIHAADTREAISRVRETLGDDAVILASQPTADGVRLTAAVERREDDLANLLAPPDASGARQEIVAALAYHLTPAAARDGLLAALPEDGAGDAGVLLTQALSGWARFRPMAQPTERPLMLVGPHGSGKTAATARLVVDALLAGRDVQVMSTDTARAGGLAQLQALLQPLGRAPIAVPDGGQLPTRLAETGAATVIDTAGVNPFRGEELARLAELMRLSSVEPVLVLPAGLCAEDSLEIAANFAAIGVRRMIVTKLDAARRLGGVLAAAATGIALAAAAIGPTIGRGSATLSAAGLSRLLLRRPGPGREGA
jgi:flagellar biosynthesis protein FlhF